MNVMLEVEKGIILREKVDESLNDIFGLLREVRIERNRYREVLIRIASGVIAGDVMMMNIARRALEESE